MEYIYLGRITNTHGLKGELKIKSNFKYKNQVFKKDFNIFIGPKKEQHKIISYRPHQEYDMVILENLLDIDEVLKYKGSLVFINKDDLKLNDNEYLNEDLIGLKAYFNDKYLGNITSITDEGNNNEIIRINNICIPKHNNFIDHIDLEKKEIYLKNVEGLI